MSTVTQPRCTNYERSVPIAIPTKTYNQSDESEYCLNQNVFDPNKCSPPNSFNERLMQRFMNSGSYQDNHFTIFLKK
uniref:Uncharacterized protein n=1 Tax=viral metagenome TaxID=1070528 RepID=A0A6C0CQU1_9ZZZZ